MPRRGKRPPAEGAEARLGAPEERFGDPPMHCGRCGQELLGIHVMGFETWGWWLDGDTLRPTPHHRAQRQRARVALTRGVAQSPAEQDRLVEKLKLGRFSRGGGWTGPLQSHNRWLDRHRIECPACGAENRVPSDSQPT